MADAAAAPWLASYAPGVPHDLPRSLIGKVIRRELGTSLLNAEA